MDVYHESATFSFQANTHIPDRARIQGFQHSKEMPKQSHLQWPSWLAAGSRNLSRVAGAVDKMVQSLHVGREEVVKAISSLPQTIHDVAAAPEKFCVDAWPITQDEKTILFLSVHGQFIEGANSYVKSKSYRVSRNIDPSHLSTCWRHSIFRSVVRPCSCITRVKVRLSSSLADISAISLRRYLALEPK